MVMAWSPLLLVFFLEDCFWPLEKQAVCVHCSGPRLCWMLSASQHRAGQWLQHAAQAVQQFPSPSLQDPRHSTKLLGRGCP